MKKLLTYISTIFLSLTVALAQDSNQPEVDSLVAKIKTAESQEKIMEIADLIATTSNDPQQVLEYAKIQAEIAERLDNKNYLMGAYCNMGWAYMYMSDYNKSLEYYTKQYQLAETMDSISAMGKALFNMGSLYYMSNDLQKSTMMYMEALKICINEDNLPNLALIYRNISNNCNDMSLYDAAEKNLKKAFEIDTKLCDSMFLSMDYICMASVIIDKNSAEGQGVIKNIKIIDQANSLADQAPPLFQNLADDLNKTTLEFLYNKIKAEINLNYYLCTENNKFLDSAQIYNAKFFDLAYEVWDQENLTISKINEAKILKHRKKYSEALDTLKCLDKFDLDSMWVINAINICELKSDLYAELGDNRHAYEYLKLYKKYKDRNLSTSLLLQNAEFNADAKFEETISDLNTQNFQKSEELEHQKKVNWLYMLLIVLILFVLLIIFAAYIYNKRTVQLLNEKNAQLNAQQEEIITQRNVINEQKEAAEKSNLMTYQSICYARHIQHAALPSTELINRIFPQNFVYFRPKDIVSGDFYYVTQNGGMDIFVLADCTGHGVPGGFLSMLGISALKELLRNPETELLPGNILDLTREYIKQALSNDEDDIMHSNNSEETYSTADGMDMSVMAYDRNNNIVKFAGAYHSLYIVHEGNINRIKGDRMPVGRHINESENFQTQSFQVQSGDMIYLATDGIPSQIGPSGKKFMNKRLVQFFQDNWTLPCNTQLENLSTIMKEWLFGVIQVDDLSLVGIKVE